MANKFSGMLPSPESSPLPSKIDSEHSTRAERREKKEKGPTTQVGWGALTSGVVKLTPDNSPKGGGKNIYAADDKSPLKRRKSPSGKGKSPAG